MTCPRRNRRLIERGSHARATSMLNFQARRTSRSSPPSTPTSRRSPRRIDASRSSPCWPAARRAAGARRRAIACPTTRVDSTRESRMARRFAAVYRQLTLRPARLITTSHPSSSFDQSRATPSQGTRATAPTPAAHHDDFVSVPLKCAGENGADMPGSAGNHDLHGITPVAGIFRGSPPDASVRSCANQEDDRQAQQPPERAPTRDEYAPARGPPLRLRWPRGCRRPARR